MRSFRDNDNGDAPRRSFTDFVLDHKKTIGTVAAVGAVFGWAVSRYNVALPHQFLALTGPGISGVHVAKQAVRWPFQTVTILDMTPWTLKVRVDGITKDKQNIGLPMIFTVGPDPTKLEQFATFISSSEKPTDLIHGFIDTEARAVVARLNIEQINGDRGAFRHEVEQCATEDLSGLGMKIWQSGVEEVDDGKHQKDGGNGTQYFHFLRKIKAAEAEQTARQSVAEMQKTGDITVKENESQTRMRNAELEAKAVETESTNNILIAKMRSAQDVEQARAKQLTVTAQIECDKATQLREAELLRELNVKNIAQETEKERSLKMAKVTVEAEAMERLAQAKLFAAEQDAKALVAKLRAEADGALAKSTADAEGIRLRTKAEADGFLAKSMAEAEGIRLKMDAEAEGQEKLKKSLGDSETLIQREMIKEGTYVKVAEASAQGLHGLKPTIWSMDGGNADTFKSLAPYLQLVANAVGVKLPDGSSTSTTKKD